MKTLLQQLLIPRQSQCTLSKVEKPEFQVSTDITVTKKDRNPSLAWQFYQQPIILWLNLQATIKIMTNWPIRWISRVLLTPWIWKMTTNSLWLTWWFCEISLKHQSLMTTALFWCTTTWTIIVTPPTSNRSFIPSTEDILFTWTLMSDLGMLL